MIEDEYKKYGATQDLDPQEKIEFYEGLKQITLQVPLELNDEYILTLPSDKYTIQDPNVLNDNKNNIIAVNENGQLYFINLLDHINNEIYNEQELLIEEKYIDPKFLKESQEENNVLTDNGEFENIVNIFNNQSGKITLSKIEFPDFEPLKSTNKQILCDDGNFRQLNEFDIAKIGGYPLFDEEDVFLNGNKAFTHVYLSQVKVNSDVDFGTFNLKCNTINSEYLEIGNFKIRNNLLTEEQNYEELEQELILPDQIQTNDHDILYVYGEIVDTQTNTEKIQLRYTNIVDLIERESKMIPFSKLQFDNESQVLLKTENHQFLFEDGKTTDLIKNEHIQDESITLEKMYKYFLNTNNKFLRDDLTYDYIDLSKELWTNVSLQLDNIQKFQETYNLLEQDDVITRNEQWKSVFKIINLDDNTDNMISLQKIRLAPQTLFDEGILKGDEYLRVDGTWEPLKSDVNLLSSKGFPDNDYQFLRGDRTFEEILSSNLNFNSNIVITNSDTNFFMKYNNKDIISYQLDYLHIGNIKLDFVNLNSVNIKKGYIRYDNGTLYLDEEDETDMNAIFMRKNATSNLDMKYYIIDNCLKIQTGEVYYSYIDEETLLEEQINVLKIIDDNGKKLIKLGENVLEISNSEKGFLYCENNTIQEQEYVTNYDIVDNSLSTNKLELSEENNEYLCGNGEFEQVKTSSIEYDEEISLENIEFLKYQSQNSQVDEILCEEGYFRNVVDLINEESIKKINPQKLKIEDGVSQGNRFLCDDYQWKTLESNYDILLLSGYNGDSSKYLEGNGVFGNVLSENIVFNDNITINKMPEENNINQYRIQFNSDNNLTKYRLFNQIDEINNDDKFTIQYTEKLSNQDRTFNIFNYEKINDSMYLYSDNVYLVKYDKQNNTTEQCTLFSHFNGNTMISSEDEANGIIYYNGQTFAQLSSKNFKTNIKKKMDKDILQRIMQLNVYTFNMKPNNEYIESSVEQIKEQIQNETNLYKKEELQRELKLKENQMLYKVPLEQGLLSEEVQEIFNYSHNKKLKYINETGNYREEENYKDVPSIDYNEIVCYLILGIEEMEEKNQQKQLIIEEQESEIEQLEKDMKYIKSQISQMISKNLI